MHGFGDYDDLVSATLLLVLLVGAAAAGHLLLPRLPERHRSRETLDTVRLVSSLVITFAALVLGLLTASVNTDFDRVGDDMNALAARIGQTNNCLASYGPEAAPIRALLHAYTAGAIASTWPEEPAPSGAYPTDQRTGQHFENLALGSLLQQARVEILKLPGGDPGRQALAGVCAAEFAGISDARWRLIGEAHRSISMPFYRLLVLMLVTVFVSFGLNAPRNALAQVSILISALTIAAAVFVVLELDGPLDGVIKVPSTALRETLAELAADMLGSTARPAEPMRRRKP